MEKFIGKRSVVYKLESFGAAHEVPMMMAVCRVIAKDPSIVLLVNEVINKCQVVTDDVPARVLPCFFANFSGSKAAFDVYFSIDDFFNRDTSQGMTPVSHRLILPQACLYKSRLRQLNVFAHPSTINPVMSTRIRSHAKINLGLAIGPARADGYHALATIYQTLAIHDLVNVTAKPLANGAACHIVITCTNPRVPCDARNTCWKMVERALVRLKIAAQVSIHIEKRLPVQGGLGAGSANAAAALIGLEKELGVTLPAAERLAIAAEVGSDVPLFLIGGTVLGLGRGEEVEPLPDLPQTHCVLAVPSIGVSTPQAFRDWDQRQAQNQADSEAQNPAYPTGRAGNKLTADPASDRLKLLGRTWTAALAGSQGSVANATGVFPARAEIDRAENLLLELVRAGIVNDFEPIVFTQYPSLHGILETLKKDFGNGTTAIYAALSGSGSALFGLYATAAESQAAAERLAAQGVSALKTKFVGREEYWRDMVCEVR